MHKQKARQLYDINFFIADGCKQLPVKWLRALQNFLKVPN